ncbi:tetratricopeptide repeat protein [Rossellomorea sp. H39__3]
MAGIVGVPKSGKKIRQLLFLAVMIIILSLSINRGWNDDPLKMSVDHVNAMAAEKLALEKWEEAEALLRPVAEKGDPDAIVYFQLSYAEIQLNKMDQAEEHLKKAIQEDESLPEAHYNLAYILQSEEGKGKKPSNMPRGPTNCRLPMRNLKSFTTT